VNRKFSLAFWKWKKTYFSLLFFFFLIILYNFLIFNFWFPSLCFLTFIAQYQNNWIKYLLSNIWKMVRKLLKITQLDLFFVFSFKKFFKFFEFKLCLIELIFILLFFNQICNMKSLNVQSFQHKNYVSSFSANHVFKTKTIKIVTFSIKKRAYLFFRSTSKMNVKEKTFWIY